MIIYSNILSHTQSTDQPLLLPTFVAYLQFKRSKTHSHNRDLNETKSQIALENHDLAFIQVFSFSKAASACAVYMSC